MKQQLKLQNEAEMAQFAKTLWRIFIKTRQNAIIFALEGELGSGKTTFTKSLAKEMGIKETITSPTFILHDEYPGFDHIDTWRMESPQELANLGLQKMIDANRVIVIEWADKFKDYIDSYRSQIPVIWVKFEYSDHNNERKVTYENPRH
jgi:tRNA threonylcarbamoyl adenosine modification protein YjeE